MGTRYVVEVAAVSEGDRADIARRVAQTFGVSVDKAERLLRRTPGVVTKPVPEPEAQTVAGLFAQAGLSARVRPAEERQVEAAPPVAVADPPPPSAPPPEPPAPVEPPVAAADRSAEATPVPEASPRAVAPRPRRSIRTKFLLVGVVPALLTVTAAVAAIVLTLPGVLRTQLLEGARNPAIAFASSVEGVLAGSFDEPGVLMSLQAMLERSRPAFEAQNVSFVLVTDLDGHPRAGWVMGADSLSALADEVYTGVRQRAAGAMARAFAEQHAIAMGPVDPPSRLIDLAGTRIEVASQAIQRGPETVGAVVIGIADEVIAERVNALLLNTVALSALPVLLALVIAILLARSQTRQILNLTKAADQMSRGDLTTSVLIESNDELGELSRALERMRISLQESLERLRRRRR
jgi:HAMP domain-containing protein